MKRWLAGALLVLLGLLASPDAVPIYDGVGTDDPYRYVGRSPAPSSATLTTRLGSSGSGEINLQTKETGPQLLVNLASGAFTGSATSLTLTATPSTGDGTLPSGSFDGNAYRITATSGAMLDVQAAQGFLFLRAAVMTKGPAPVIVHRATPTAPWTQLTTTTSGRDILSTPFRELGDYAVVRLPGATALSQSGGLGTTRLLFLGGGVALLVVLTVLVLRRPGTDED